MDYSNQETLLQALIAGDNIAFETLRKDTFHSISKIIEADSGIIQNAEDLYNDGIIILLEKIRKPDFVLKGAIGGMLYSICKLQYKNIQKKEINGRKYISDYSEELHVDRVDEKLDRELFRSIFRSSIKKLKDDCQKILNKLFAEISFENIAKELGFSEKYTRKRKWYCQKALSQEIAKNQEFRRILDDKEMLSAVLERYSLS